MFFNILVSLKKPNQNKTRTALTDVAQWAGHYPENQKVEVQFLVRARAWAVGHIPCCECVRSNQSMFLSHIDVSLPLSSPVSLVQ